MDAGPAAADAGVADAGCPLMPRTMIALGQCGQLQGNGKCHDVLQQDCGLRFFRVGNAVFDFAFLSPSGLVELENTRLFVRCNGTVIDGGIRIHTCAGERCFAFDLVPKDGGCLDGG